MSRVRVIHAPGDGELAIDSSTSRWQQVGMGVLIVLHHILAFAPMLIVLALYAASWRAEGLIGHWPQPSIDDPWYGMPDDVLYKVLYLSVIPLMMYCIVSGIGFPAFTLVLWHKYPFLWNLVLIAMFVGGLILIMSNPGQRFTWYMD